MLEVENLHIRYGAISALHGVNITVQSGETVAVLGANGAGKSSLLNGIIGLVKIAQGIVKLDGENITNKDTDAISKVGVSLVPEGRRIFARLTVHDNLRLGGYFLNEREFKRRTEQMLELFPLLQPRMRSFAGHLSGGEQQMLAIARALMPNPRVLLLDEPSSGLSPIATRAVYAALLEYAAAGSATILLVEQNARRALELASRAYVLELGTVRLSGPSNELSTDERIVGLYLGRDRDIKMDPHV
jgi:branched-chain amino acid transport system ATP-binding protein